MDQPGRAKLVIAITVYKVIQKLITKMNFFPLAGHKVHFIALCGATKFIF